jgi:hypothetical protein
LKFFLKLKTNKEWFRKKELEVNTIREKFNCSSSDKEMKATSKNIIKENIK